MPSFRSVTQHSRFLLACACILWFAIWVRTYNLYILPVFVDEGLHLSWSQLFAVGESYYPWLMDGKVLLVMLLSLFQVVGPSALWIARAAIALFATVGCAATIATGCHIGSPRIGLLAGVIYAFLPFAMFHDRQALADPLMADFGALAVLCVLRAAQPRGWQATVLLGVSLAAVVLSKLFGITYYAFLAVGVVVLPSSWKDRWQLLGRYTLSFIISIALIAIVLLSLSSRLGVNTGSLFGQSVGFVGCPVIICEGDLATQFSNLQNAWASITDIVTHYVGWVLIGLAILAWSVAYAHDRRKVALLGLSALVILAALMFGLKTGDSLPARYILMLTLPIAVLAAYGLFTLSERVSLLINSPSLQRAQPLPSMALSSLLVLIIFIPMGNIVPMMVNPRAGSYTTFDLFQYFEGRYGGYGFAEAVATIKEREGDSVLPPVIVVYGEYLNMVSAYFDRRQVDVRPPDKVFAADVGQWLFSGQPVYFIDEIEPNGTPTGTTTTTEGVTTEEVVRYRRHPYWEQEWAVRLRVATSADPALRQKLFSEFFIQPDKLTGDYETLAASLPATEPGTLLVYPPNQTEALAHILADTHPNISLIPVGDSWPLDTEAVSDQLAQLATQPQPVYLAVVEETKGDPQRFIETWLTTHLFRINEQWFGPVRLIAFAAEVPATQSVVVNGQFGDAIRLESIDLMDSEVAPGGLLRLRLNWQALAPMSQQFKVFTHIFAGDRIIAQHDGQPVGELRPTNTWQTGEALIDQFAIQLPADAQPGSYQLRIGIYDLVSQARLPFLLPDGSSAEFFAGGAVVVK